MEGSQTGSTRVFKLLNGEVEMTSNPVEYCQGQFRKKIDNTLGRDEHLCLAAEFDCPGEFDAILIGRLVSCFLVSYN